MEKLFVLITLLSFLSCNNRIDNSSDTQEFKNDTLNWCELQCSKTLVGDYYGKYGVVFNNDSTYVVAFNFSRLRLNTYVYNAEYVIGGKEFLKLLEKYSPIMKRYERLLREANINNYYESFSDGCRYLRINGRAAFFFGVSNPLMVEDFDKMIFKLKNNKQ